jgi:hypothetical protein
VVAWAGVGVLYEIDAGHKEVPVTQLRRMVLEELKRRNYSQGYRTRLRQSGLGIEHVRQCQSHLFQERHLALPWIE